MLLNQIPIHSHMVAEPYFLKKKLYPRLVSNHQPLVQQALLSKVVVLKIKFVCFSFHVA